MRRANSRKMPEAVDRAPPTGSQPLITTHSAPSCAGKDLTAVHTHDTEKQSLGDQQVASEALPESATCGRRSEAGNEHVRKASER